jgi:hypothetical protein
MLPPTVSAVLGMITVTAVPLLAIGENDCPPT